MPRDLGLGTDIVRSVITAAFVALCTAVIEAVFDPEPPEDYRRTRRRTRTRKAR